MDKRKRYKLILEIFKDIFEIFPRVQGQDFNSLPTDEEIMSFLRDLGHTKEINSLNDVVVNHMHQPWRTFAALINKSLSGKTTVSTKEPTRKSNRVKRPTKKSTKVLARGVIIRETPEMPLSKKKEKVDVTRDDRNNKQESSGEDNDQENDSDDDKTQSNNENELDSEHETDESKSCSESDHEENKEDEDDEKEAKDEFVKTPSNDSNDEDETKITDKAEGDEDEEMYYTTSQLYDDVDIRLNEPIDTDRGFVQEQGVTRDEFMNFLLASLTARIIEQVKNQLPQILPEEVSNFAPDEPEFKVAELDMAQDQEENPSNNDEEPKENVASKRDWFTKPTQPQELLGKIDSAAEVTEEITLISVSHIVGLDLSKLAIILNRLKKIHSKGLTSGVRASRELRKEAYIAYSNPRGFIYQNKDKQRRLMRIDELHKFSDDTLNDVRTALDDRLKGIQMKYLPQTIWRKVTRKEQQQ
uniref:Uncharacterized protein n=1 Tax=Tanacetum cinerariifolium TaxID=118510 RepID=A0A6L2JKI0_TANCI|nr:hypothetical protein [Tanacetum cinerariifolium]